MVGAQPWDWRNVGEIASPFVAPRLEVLFVAGNAGAVRVANHQLCDVFNQLRRRSSSEIVKGTGEER